jgi:hypothetical protein
VIENFIGTKSLRKILEGLKQKISIFIEIKNTPREILKILERALIKELFQIYNNKKFKLILQSPQ